MKLQKCPRVVSDKKLYRLSLICAFNEINRAWDQEEYRKYIEDAVQSNPDWKKYTAAVKAAPYFDIRNLAATIYLLNHNQPLQENEIQSIETRFQEIQLRHETQKKWKKISDETISQNKTKVWVDNQAIAMIDDLVDRITEDQQYDIKGEANKIFVIADKAGLKRPTQAHIKSIQSEFEEVYNTKDKELREAYGYGKIILKAVINAMKELSDTFSRLGKVKVVKRVKMTPEKLVKKMHPAKRMENFSIIGCEAKDLIGSTTVYVYNLIKHKLTKFVAIKGMTLSVHGMSITNFDPVISEMKKIRKEDKFFNSIILDGKLSKRELNKQFGDISQSTHKISGRVNNECIILAV